MRILSSDDARTAPPQYVFRRRRVRARRRVAYGRAARVKCIIDRVAITPAARRVTPSVIRGQSDGFRTVRCENRI